MTKIRSKVGPKGQAVIPKPVRDELGIAPGDEVYFTTHGTHAHVEKRPASEQLADYFRSLPDRRGDRPLSRQDLKQVREDQYGKRSRE